MFFLRRLCRGQRVKNYYGHNLSRASLKIPAQILRPHCALARLTTAPYPTQACPAFKMVVCVPYRNGFQVADDSNCKPSCDGTCKRSKFSLHSSSWRRGIPRLWPAPLWREQSGPWIPVRSWPCCKRFEVAASTGKVAMPRWSGHLARLKLRESLFGLLGRGLRRGSGEEKGWEGILGGCHELGDGQLEVGGLHHKTLWGPAWSSCSASSFLIHPFAPPSVRDSHSSGVGQNLKNFRHLL